jgi:hypothetical protein
MSKFVNQVCVSVISNRNGYWQDSCVLAYMKLDSAYSVQAFPLAAADNAVNRKIKINVQTFIP